jgi:hypothetical protein
VKLRKAGKEESLNIVFFECGALPQLGMWHSGSAAALHAASPEFDPPLLQAIFEWSRVRLTLGAHLALIAQW